MNFLHLWSEIKGTYPKLSTFLAKRFINRARRDIYKSHQWGFLKAEGVLYTPSVITAGTFSVTQFSSQVVADATAITALDNLSSPLLTSRQIRFSSSAPYNILTVDPLFSTNGILTLDRPVNDSTNPSISYQVYRCYFGPPDDGTGSPTTDFLRYNSIYDPTLSRHFHQPLPLARELLSRRDPQRQTFNNPSYLFVYKSASDGTPLFEMWPHFLSPRTFLCSYQRRGTDLLLDTDTLPLIIPDELVLERAHYYACIWADSMKSIYQELKGTNWTLLATLHNKAFSNISNRDPGLLQLAQVEDEETNPQTITDERTDRIFSLGDDDLSLYANITP